jgi:hypothetical protein
MQTYIHHHNEILHAVFHSPECMIRQCLEMRVDQSNISLKGSRDILHCSAKFCYGTGYYNARK